jgi:hypothetical protein
MTIGSLLSDRKREKKKEHLFILFSLYITPDGLGGCAETHTEPFSLQQQKVFFLFFSFVKSDRLCVCDYCKSLLEYALEYMALNEQRNRWVSFSKN